VNVSVRVAIQIPSGAVRPYHASPSGLGAPKYSEIAQRRMKDVVATKIEHNRGAFPIATNHYDEHISYPASLSPR
jgi:hypothetical protein